MLYVALTRPKEKLILVLSCNDLQNAVNKAVHKNGASFPPSPYVLRGMKSFGEWIITAMLGSTEIYAAADIKPVQGMVLRKSGIDVSVYPPVTGESVEELEVEDHSRVDVVLLEQLNDRLAFRYPYENIARLPGKMTVTQVTKGGASAAAVLAKPSFLLKRRFSAAERGTILHRFMQHIDLSATAVEQEIARQIEAAFLSEDQAAALDAGSIKKFLTSDIARRMREAGS